MMDAFDAVGSRLPERMSQEEIARAMATPEQRILESLADWRQANPRKRWPPRKVVIIDGRNAGNVGFVMSRWMGLTQIATGVRLDRGPDWTWYSSYQWEPANGKRRSDYGKRKRSVMDAQTVSEAAPTRSIDHQGEL